MTETKGRSEAITLVNLRVPEPEMTFQMIHRVGAKRHSQQWVAANRAAISVLWGTKVQPDDPEMRRLVSLVVLRVLDAAKLSD
jgi:hypothetical protein